MLSPPALSLADPPVIACASQADAQIQAAVHAVELGARIAMSAGPSMEPALGNPAIILVIDLPYDEIALRMIVLREKGGLVSCHRTARPDGDKWVLKGDNLPADDRFRLTRANYRGAVAMIFNFPRP